jgi:hypothetical protein
MAVKLPPIPRQPIGEHFEWREWFQKLRELASSVAGIAFNSLDFSASNITSILTRLHSDLQSLQGGGGGQYYHMTAAQHSLLTSGTSHQVLHGSPTLPTWGPVDLSTDVTGSLPSTSYSVPYGAFESFSYTTLTSNINSSVTTIPVAATGGSQPFASANTLRIEDELITYTGITSTSFTGCTRGVYGTTAKSHTSGTGVTSVEASAANTNKVIPLNITDYSNQVSIVSGSKITVAVAGLYNLQWSGQMVNLDTGINNASIWLRVNGTDVPGTTGHVTVPAVHGGVDGQIIVAWNYFVRLNANDYVELWWNNDNQHIVINGIPASTSPVMPSAAAVIVTINFVSA